MKTIAISIFFLVANSFAYAGSDFPYSVNESRLIRAGGSKLEGYRLIDLHGSLGRVEYYANGEFLVKEKVDESNWREVYSTDLRFTNSGDGGVTFGDVKVADFNSDGHDDIAIAQSVESFESGFAGFERIYFFISDGQNGFTKKEPLSFEQSSGGTSLFIQDLNRDGLPDLTVLRTRTARSLNLIYKIDHVISAKHEAFEKIESGFSFSSHSRAVSVKDINGDGFLDFVFANSVREHRNDPFKHQVSFYKGNADGSLKQFSSFDIEEEYSFDFLDAKLLVLESINSGPTKIMSIRKVPTGLDVALLVRKNGSSKFRLSNLDQPKINTWVDSYQFADINGDGVDDIIAYADLDSTLYTLDGASNFQTMEQLPGLTIEWPSGSGYAQISSLAVYDYNSDGKNDFSFSSGASLYRFIAK